MGSSDLTTSTGSAKSLAQLRLLAQVSTQLQSLIDSENFFQAIVNTVQSQFNFYGVNIWSVAADGSARLEAQSGAYGRHLKLGHRLSAGEGIIGSVIRSRRTYVSGDVSRDPHFTRLELPIQTRSELCVPVLKRSAESGEPETGADVVAVINLESERADAFDANDVTTLEILSTQISVAIANRGLYQEVKDFNARLKETVDVKTAELRQAQERILEQSRLLQKENRALKTLVHHDKSVASDIIGKSPAILSIISMVDKIAPTTATVLIQGESGTGKELIARRLHFQSERAAQPYVTVNCGALQESLLESELFGHEKGSFTGAINQKLGLCEMADGGTLFLDEIGEMSLGIQAKLLRFLQDGEFYRIGGKRSIRVSVRVVSATNRELENEVREGRFREDLFYRLNTITLRMPPLRKRKEDIPLLVDFLLKNSRFGGSANQIKRIDPRVIEVFQNYDWPGNIRELQNTVERLKILADNHEIKLDDVPFGIRVPKVRAQGKSDAAEFGVDLPLDEVEKIHILRTLAYHHGNKTKSAQSLGITIKTLYNKLHRYGLLPQSGASGGPAADSGSVSS